MMKKDRLIELLANCLGWMLEEIHDDERLFRTLKDVIGMTKEELNDFCIESLDELYDADSISELNDEEYRILLKIARNTKMNCWFHLSTDKNGEYFVFDLEDKGIYTIREALLELVEGIVSYELCGLTNDEISVFEGLLTKLQIKADIPQSKG